MKKARVTQDQQKRDAISSVSEQQSPSGISGSIDSGSNRKHFYITSFSLVLSSINNR